MRAHHTPSELPEQLLIARRLRVSGRVQGVGFRPFVHRLAREIAIAGTVQNLRGEVEIVAQGHAEALDRFVRELIDRAPPLAVPQMSGCCPCEVTPREDFEILPSAAVSGAGIALPPDYSMCSTCLAEMMDETDRRHRYPFINCTQCGPRYTLILQMPYDRAATTMARFPLCDDCRRDYENPLDRRFHAEPIACPVCGPQLWLEEGTQRVPGSVALSRTVDLLRDGAVVAVKGIGGYHLLCDATRQQAVENLRARKLRPHKPLAVMFPCSGRDNLDRVRSEILLSAAEADLLRSPARPIVLARKRAESTLASAIAPGLTQVGIFLPYSPLHHLLLSDFGGPLVATSGNLSGDPVLTEPDEARTGLARVADAGLHHDRPIARLNDDPVTRVVLGRARTLRLGRGLAPRELDLAWPTPQPLLAVGGHMKTTVALAWDRRVIVSPHICDMGTVRGESVFEQVVEDLQRLYAVRAEQIVCDAHPNYATALWADRSGLPVVRVLHHHAHASALAGEHDPDAPMIVFTWDGVGFGSDQTLWGGETFLGVPGEWRRVASLRPFRLPGGGHLGRSPWRSAAGLCWELGQELPEFEVAPLVRSAWQHNLNSPVTSAAGRLFDGAAALVLRLYDTTYEGQAPMMLEAVAAEARQGLAGCEPLPTYRDSGGLLRLDWEPLIRQLLSRSDSPAISATIFHARLAVTIAAVAEELRRSSGVDLVGLTGGVFQNTLLTELAHDQLSAKGFRVCLAEHIPCNDGGLSFGQILETVSRRRQARSGLSSPLATLAHKPRRNPA